MVLKRQRKQFLLLCIDIVLLCLSVYISLVIRKLELTSSSSYFRHLHAFTPMIGFWIIVQYIIGLYSLENAYHNVINGFRFLITAFVTLGFGVAWFYIVPSVDMTPKTILLVFIGVSFLLVFGWRNFFTLAFLKFSKKTPVAVVGLSSAIDELIDFSKKFSYVHYSIDGIFCETTQKTYRGVKVYNDFNAFLQFVKDSEIEQIIIIDRHDLSEKVHNNLFSLLKRRVSFISIAKFYESYVRKIPLSEINEMWFLQNIDLREKKLYVPVKRFFDIFFAGILLLLTLPFYPFIALIIKLESKGPVFFVQTRSGYLGNNFKLLKFRSMSVTDNDFAPTAKKDVRVTKFGNFMRKTRIDEIPQFINALKGDMSLIGPRPERPELIADLQKNVPYYLQRLLVKPGISGWDQVSGEYHSPSVEDTIKKLQYDLYYVKNMSIFLDISIIARTIRTVLSRGGL